MSSCHLLGGEEARSFDAIMYTQWVPPVLTGCANGSSCTIPVPLGLFRWNWSGDAINTMQVHGGGVVTPTWLLNDGYQTNLGFELSNPGTDPNYSFPTWTNVSGGSLGTCN
jgi:hypothetical protein